MNKISFLILSALALAGSTAQAQLKIGDNTGYIGPSSILEIQSTNKALVLPRVANTTLVTSPTNGMMVYDLSTQAVRVYQNGAWDTLSQGAAPATVRVNCDDTGFTGTMNSLVALIGAHYIVRVQNNTGATATYTPAASDITLSGVSGMIVGTPFGGGSIGSGSSTLVYYPIMGTPQADGTLTAVLNKTLTNPATTLNCSSSRSIKRGEATFPLPQIIRGVNSVATSPGIISNTAPNKVTIAVPYTGGTGSYTSYTSPVVTATGQGGDTNGLSLTYSAASFNSNRILVTVVVSGDGTFNVKQMPVGAEEVFATLPLQVNGEMIGEIVLKAIGGVMDARGYVYMPVAAPNGKLWLNNNLGADYANPSHEFYNPLQQAISRDDFHAYGSTLQHSRKADGHELVNWTSSTAGTGVNGNTYALSDNPSNSLFILVNSNPGDWRNNNGPSEWSDSDNEYNPCPAGYRVSKFSDFQGLPGATTVSGNPDAIGGLTNQNLFNGFLKLSQGGQRAAYDGSVVSSNANTRLWLKDAFYQNAFTPAIWHGRTIFGYDYQINAGGTGKAQGHPVRCIKRD